MFLKRLYYVSKFKKKEGRGEKDTTWGQAGYLELF